MDERFEVVHQLDTESLQAFAQKGVQDGRRVVQSGNANGLKVRRVMQIVSDLARKPLSELRILDVACGEGVYSIEAALHGAEVLGFDGRTERMSQGIRCAEINGLSNVRFQVDDARKITRETHGQFDVILLLGILYHLDVPDVFHVLESLYDVCSEFVIIDTHVSLREESEVSHGGYVYRGRKTREHGDSDTAETRQSHLLMSIDNTFAFQFTRDSLIRLLNNVGFTTVFECLAPLEPNKPADRVTFVAHKGQRARLSTYPWVNDLTEQEVTEAIGATIAPGPNDGQEPTQPHKPRRLVGKAVNRLLHPLGLQIRSVR